MNKVPTLFTHSIEYSHWNAKFGMVRLVILSQSRTSKYAPMLESGQSLSPWWRAEVFVALMLCANLLVKATIRFVLALTSIGKL
jgi:hypothetical protein